MNKIERRVPHAQGARKGGIRLEEQSPSVGERKADQSTKYAWLKSMPDKRCADAVAFRHLYQTTLKTSRAWAFRESFAAFWDYRYPKSAGAYFDAWSTRAMRSRIEPIKKVVKMLRRHRQGLLNYTRYRITNAAAEGFNSIIQTIKANARGFRSFENFRIRILFLCGKLDLQPVNGRSH